MKDAGNNIDVRRLKVPELKAILKRKSYHTQTKTGALVIGLDGNSAPFVYAYYANDGFMMLLLQFILC